MKRKPGGGRQGGQKKGGELAQKELSGIKREMLWVDVYLAIANLS